jgi:hypothetical protein
MRPMLESHKRLVENATIHAESIADIKRDQLTEILHEYSFARVTGLVTPEAADRSLALLKEKFRVENDHATTGEKPSEVRTNFQKMSIGCAKHGGVDRPRFMRAFYNPFWAEDAYEMHKNFRKVAQLRNFLSERPIDFAIDKDEGGMWTAARMHQFPRGGGFMVAHRDTVLPAAYKSANLGEFYQPVLLLTQKGMHFEKGGGYSEFNGEQIIYEDFTQRGDVAIYDTSTVHGVEDVDPTEKYVHNTVNGRISALVTLYRSL